MFKTFTLAHSWANHLTESPYYKKLLNISGSFLNTVVKVKTRMVLWLQKSCKCFPPLAAWSRCWLGTVAHHHRSMSESLRQQITSLAKGQNSKYSSYWMCTALSYSQINYKNHCKSGTICTQCNTSSEDSSYPGNRADQKTHAFSLHWDCNHSIIF